MAAVQPIRKQSYEQIHQLLKAAILQRRCLSARYRGLFRQLCPQVLGRNAENLMRVLAYQYGGESASGLGPVGSPSNWRCIAIDKLTDVKMTDDPWITPPAQAGIQTCITSIEVDAETRNQLNLGAAE